jgi:uncharacterized protein with HEPN domain
MSDENPDLKHLWDMLTAARNVQAFVRSRTQEEYETDLLLRSAVERQVEIIGEAARRVSKIFQSARPEIPGEKSWQRAISWRTNMGASTTRSCG